MNLQIISNSLLKHGELGGYSVIELENNEVLISNLTKSQAEEYVLVKEIHTSTDRHFELMLSMCFNGGCPDIDTQGDFIIISTETRVSLPGPPLEMCMKYLRIRGYKFWNFESGEERAMFNFKKVGEK